ncbi:matrixin family metalloprotease [Spongisporangium articulatum]|uniref:Matrixin family metalloprotease n=1 Tax=Spongisporangium articulatum TaxID=3362603 RepID=A0ABW8ALH0_9ACTN
MWSGRRVFAVLVPVALGASLLSGAGTYVVRSTVPEAGGQRSSGTQPVVASHAEAVAVTPKRLLPKVPLSTEGSYKFIHRISKTKPVTWDPCRTVKIYVNPANGPSDAVSLVKYGAARLRATTGIDFRYAGQTKKSQKRAMKGARDGVWVGFHTESSDRTLAGATVGYAGDDVDGATKADAKYYKGAVVLESETFKTLRAYRQTSIARAIVMHEFGHIAGLDHVNDPHQLMYPETTRDQLTYGGGDLRGLALLGRGTCRTSV